MSIQFFKIPMLAIDLAQSEAVKVGVDIKPCDMEAINLYFTHISAMYWDDEDEVTDINIDGLQYISPLKPEQIIKIINR